MRVTKSVCQLRRDLREEIPEAVLQNEHVRKAVARIIGKERPQEEDDETKRLLELLARDESQRAMAVRRRLAARVVVQNGYFKCREPDRPGRGFIVEDLSVSPDSLYVRAIGTTEDCRQVIESAVVVLTQHDVPQSVFQDYEEDFATLTIAQLDGSIEGFFSEPFRRFLQRDLLTAAREDDETRVVIHPYEISVKVHTWQRDAENPEKATPERWDFHILHATFDDHDRCVYTVRTEFDYAKHVKMLEILEQCVKQSPGETRNA